MKNKNQRIEVFMESEEYGYESFGERDTIGQTIISIKNLLSDATKQFKKDKVTRTIGAVLSGGENENI